MTTTTAFTFFAVWLDASERVRANPRFAPIWEAMWAAISLAWGYEEFEARRVDAPTAYQIPERCA